MVVWKFKLARNEVRQLVAMPTGARALYAVEQYGNIVMYALVNPQAASGQRVVWILDTGVAAGMSEQAQPLGVLSLAGGILMLHVFIEP